MPAQDQSQNQTQDQCRLLWNALKARGNATVAEIEAIDKVTPWSEVEPRWWIEMMDEKQKLLNQPPITRLPVGTARGLKPDTVGDLIYRQHSIVR